LRGVICAADVATTRKLVEAGTLLNVPALDHVITDAPSTSRSGFFSMAAVMG